MIRTSASLRACTARLLVTGVLYLSFLAGTGAATAQSPFSAAVRINDSIVTYYEIDQRALFLEVLRAPGDLREEALETLVNERLQTQAARMAGTLATPEQIEAGVAEFAARTELSVEQFLRVLGEEGVAPETFRDFVANGLHWRNLIQARFGPRARISDTEVDQALAYAARADGARILLAEIVIPLTEQNQDTLRDDLGQLAQDLNGRTDDFSAAAERFSAAGTRENGGLTGWRPLSAVPPNLRELFVTLRPGETTAPVPLGPAIGIFQMRGLSDGPVVAPTITSVDYATIAIPGGRTEAAMAEAAALRDAVDTCDDLYGVLPGGFERQDVPVSQIARDVAMALSVLDAGEMSTEVLRADGGVLLVAMLCGRTTSLPEGGRAQVREQLFAQRLESYADGLLEELRADAIIAYD